MRLDSKIAYALAELVEYAREQIPLAKNKERVSYFTGQVHLAQKLIIKTGIGINSEVAQILGLEQDESGHWHEI